MKIGMLAAALCCALATEAAGQDWVAAGQSETTLMGFNRISVQQTNEGLGAWTILAFAQRGDYQGQGYDYIAAVQFFDCNSFRARSETTYGFLIGDDRPTFTLDESSDWTTPGPGTVAETLLMAVCSGSNFRPETSYPTPEAFVAAARGVLGE